MPTGSVIGIIAESKEFNGFDCAPSICAGVGDKSLDMSAVTSSWGLVIVYKWSASNSYIVNYIYI